ncbi:MAG: energy-coupling factor transporter transmembrane protein EcfT [Actinomycetales bacterium]|nr:energy-coupling factor transporter transmembrane protein EcfT [Actinomycetales bacterium]
MAGRGRVRPPAVWSIPVGIYHPGSSVLHRLPVGAKLVALLVTTSMLVLLRSGAVVLAGALIVVAGYALARIPPRLALAQAWPLRWFVLILIPTQAWLAGWQTAAVVVGTMLITVLLAGLVTLTTRTADLLAWTDRALGRLPGGAMISLILVLAIRAIAVLSVLLQQAHEARMARGMQWSARALVTPVVIRSIGYAHGLGEALMARGLDDDAPDPPAAGRGRRVRRG